MILVMTAPIRATDMIVCGIKGACFCIILFMRMRPYPPSFRRIAARIIDPARGASTCAFGSHACRENNGSFTMKGTISIIHAVC